MDMQNEPSDSKGLSESTVDKAILDLSDTVIYFGTPTSAEKRLHTVETPLQHVSSRRKTVLLPSKTVLFSTESLNQQENCKEKKKNRRQSYLYATKNSVMLEQQRLIEVQNDEDVALFSASSFEENALFIEAPGSVERKIKKKNDLKKTLPSLQKRMEESRGFSIFDTVIPHSISTITRRKSISSLLQKQNKTLNCTFKKKPETYEAYISSYVKIQACIRGYLVRKSIILQNQAARIIQLKYITILSRRNFHKQRRSAIIIQAAWRGWVARIRYLQIVEACICIQKWWRQLSHKRKMRQKDAISGFQEKEVLGNVSNNSSLQGFLKKWESKRALATTVKDKNEKKEISPKKNNGELMKSMKENFLPYLVEEPSQKTDASIALYESPKLSKKVSRSKTSLPDSKSATSMTMMLRQSISLSTARILSNSTKQLSSANTHNCHTSFQNLSKLPKSRLTAPRFTSRTTVLGDISPNLLREDTIEVLSTPTKGVKVDGISTGALRVSTPSPKKCIHLGSPSRKALKKPVISRKTALLVPQNIKLSHSSQTTSENTPSKKNSNLVNNGFGSPSKQKIDQIESFKNIETNGEERVLCNRSKMTNSKTLPSSNSQLYVPIVKHNTISQNLYTPYRSLNYLTLGEITKITRQNTYQNRLYRCDFDRVIIRKNQLRPPSPTAKSQSRLAAEAHLRRKRLQKEKTHDYVLGPGDDDNWVPRELTSLKKGVRWDKLLESEPKKHIFNHTLERLSLGKTKVQKACLSKKTQMIRLDDFGNVLDAREPLTPIIGKAEKVIVQKFLYKGEEDE
ncbi:hypothetical protein PORY_001622 [Pneumocystis oryctolagi]|uniref:Uncharacterized protein n=1 Tax=Pneumocystis oryctolagi TaxID=42067 RepID=A0ACB7CEM7_9ASCO|nr:hypothetical protein PORY_001622 [Pneumocystis oryctolagi]